MVIRDSVGCGSLNNLISTPSDELSVKSRDLGELLRKSFAKYLKLVVQVVENCLQLNDAIERSEGKESFVVDGFDSQFEVRSWSIVTTETVAVNNLYLHWSRGAR